MTVPETARGGYALASLRTTPGLVPRLVGWPAPGAQAPSMWPKSAGEPSKRPDVAARGTPAAAGSTLLETCSGGASGSTHNAQGSAAPQPAEAPVFGYATGWDTRYRILKELGRGGNGIVTLVQDLQTGQEYATKSIPKVLTDPNLSDSKRSGHAAAIRREVEVMRRLRGCLNVASLEEVYEDDTHVHLVMEACRGGELHHAVGERHYSERTVASYMRATLKTLAQCHSHKILHRDIKPGNFLLLDAGERAPLKAIDFGLAVFYDDKELPRTDLGLEGTPWFMAPETLQSRVYPASDLWAAGVMAHQLLTGRFPFDDRSNPFSPSLTKIWKAILTEEVNTGRSYWEGVSEEARDFVKALLNKDPAKRPTAREALKHPWLQGGIEERSQGRPLSLAVVQRIQRYAQSSVFKRTVLELIAEELLEAPEEQKTVCRITDKARPVITSARDAPLEFLFEQVDLQDKEVVDREEVAGGLQELGYRLAPEELERLLDQLDTGHTGMVAKSQLAASQIDWEVLERDHTERWLSLVRAAFAELDTDGDGVLSIEEIMGSLRSKLPASEVESAVRQALHEASRRSEGSRHEASTAGANSSSTSGGGGEGSLHGGSLSGGEGSLHGGSGGSAGSSMHGVSNSVRGGLNFRQFVRMLRAGSADSLDLFDDRLGSSFGSVGSLGAAAMESTHGSTHFSSTLQTVPEELAAPATAPPSRQTSGEVSIQVPGQPERTAQAQERAQATQAAVFGQVVGDVPASEHSSGVEADGEGAVRGGRAALASME